MDKALKEYINNCLLCKLSKDYHENEYHPEFQVRNNKLKEIFTKLISLLENEDFNLAEIQSSTLAVLLILNLELQSKGPWNTEDTKPKEYSEKLNQIFINKHHVKLNEILQSNIFNSQVIFDECIKELHKKMNTVDFRKYPALIEAYCLLVKNVKNYKIKINPVTVLPVALLLIEDYIPANKIKGLQSCTAIFQCLTIEDFTAGNYCDVVYSSLKKNIVQKDKEVTQELFQCLIEYLKIVTSDIKKNKLDDIFSDVVDQLNTESNLYRKVDYFDFITKIIEMHGIHCGKKKVFKEILRENIDICGNEGVYEILLLHVLECLQTWIKHCWCIWRLSADHRILSALFKILYLAKEETTKLKIQNLISTLVNLCAKDEQMVILENLQEPFECSDEDFLLRLDMVKKQISTEH